MRRLVIGAAVYHYAIGSSHALIQRPDGRRQAVPLDQLAGRSWATLERGRWKRTEDGMITPADVRTYIERRF